MKKKGFYDRNTKIQIGGLPITNFSEIGSFIMTSTMMKDKMTVAGNIMDSLTNKLVK
jgi:hypothetical protein